MWALTIALVVLVCTLILLLYRKRCGQQKVFQTMGIPGPTPHWLYGNFHEMKDKLPHDVYVQWGKQYGETYGYYEGPLPILVSSDLDFLQQVFIKDFKNFNARMEFALQGDSDEDHCHMFMATGSRWKRLRSIINPTFSTSKLKQMYPLIRQKADLLVSCVEKVSDTAKPTDVLPLYQALTLDVIGETAFGLPCDSQRNPEDFMLVAARKMNDMLSPDGKPFIMTIAELLPEVKRLLAAFFFMIMNIVKMPMFVLADALQKVVEEREKAKGEARCDLLQLMMNAEAESSSMDQSDRWTMSAGVEHTEDPTQGAAPIINVQKKLTRVEIIAQSLLFLNAGYETTSVTLAFTTFLLATNPDVQEKLLEEIDRVLPHSVEVEFEDMPKLPYLHMVLCETLRLYPIGVNVVSRKCMKACTLNGISLPEGLIIRPNMWHIHHSPEIWGDDPETFIPERFMKEECENRHPMAWIAFGAGPRNCVGLRFALIEAKLALVKILQKFRFEECTETRQKLGLKQSLILLPSHGIHVKIVPRLTDI